MANLTIINAINQDLPYNFIFRIKVEDYPELASRTDYPSSGYKSFNFVRHNIGNVSKIDWGNGVVENNPSSKLVEYGTGEYVIKMRVESFANILNLEHNNISEFIEVPYDILPNHINISTNKIPKNGLLAILNGLANRFTDVVPLFEFVKTNQFIFKANGQVGHLKRSGAAGNSKGFYRTTVAGQEILKTTPEQQANFSRSQAELDAAKVLIDRNWLVEMSFDQHYRTLMPYTEAAIFQDGETGDIEKGCETFHMVPTYDSVTKQVSGTMVRVNLRNGYWNDERFHNTDTRRRILPQKIYAQWQVKRASETTFVDTFIPIDIVPNSQGLYKTIKPADLSSLNLQSGDQIRAKIYGKYGEIFNGSPNWCSNMFASRANHDGVVVNYTLTIE